VKNSTYISEKYMAEDPYLKYEKKIRISTGIYREYMLIKKLSQLIVLESRLIYPILNVQ
jgi:hypothetical protein